MNNKKVVIVDLDDTLSNTEKRSYILEKLVELKEKKSLAKTKEEKEILNTLQEQVWNEFNKRCKQDYPIMENIEKIKKYQSEGYKIFAFSGRFEFTRTDTIEYFKSLGIEFDLLKLRRPEQKMKTEYLKNAWLNKYVKEEGLELKLFIDDNKDIIEYLKNKHPADSEKFIHYEMKSPETKQSVDIEKKLRKKMSI